MSAKTERAKNTSVNEMDYLQITKDIKESPRIQKTEYIRQQMLKRRAMEDELMAKLMQEQSVIDSFRNQINEELDQTEELSRYNMEFRESMKEQIYSLHGISKDKLEGMSEYKNALRRGCNFILFFLSIAMIILCGVLHGFQSGICLLMLALTGIEGAMLAQDDSMKDYPILLLLNRIFYPLMFILMMAAFVCYELNFPQYELFLPIVSVAGIIVLLLSVSPYFMYNPYNGIRKNMRDAKAQIKSVEKIAKKEVDKNQKIRMKEEKKEQAQQEKEERRQKRLSKKETVDSKSKPIESKKTEEAVTETTEPTKQEPSETAKTTTTAKSDETPGIAESPSAAESITPIKAAEEPSAPEEKPKKRRGRKKAAEADIA